MIALAAAAYIVYHRTRCDLRDACARCDQPEIWLIAAILLNAAAEAYLLLRGGS